VAPTTPTSSRSAALGRAGVLGRLVDAGWGAANGYPALVLDAGGLEAEVDVLESVDLAAHWARLDQFEGPGYTRVAVTVRTSADDVEASTHVLGEDARG
jgi:gamma-glutamylcyclotransferase (GGCT)/AIG2-like uncharacterized protein YtfP